MGPEQVTPELLQMYNVPGHREFGQHSHEFSRYLKDKKQDEAIQSAAENDAFSKLREISKLCSPSNTKPFEANTFLSLFDGIYQSPDTDLKIDAFKYISRLKIIEQETILKKAASNRDPLIRLRALNCLNIYYHSKNFIESLLHQGLKDDSLEVKKLSADLAMDSLNFPFTDAERDKFEKIIIQEINAYISSKDPEEKKYAISITAYIDNEQIKIQFYSEFYRQIVTEFESGDFNRIEEAAKIIKALPLNLFLELSKKLNAIIQEKLSRNMPSIQLSAARLVKFIDIHYWPSIITILLESQNSELIKIGLNLYFLEPQYISIRNDGIVCAMKRAIQSGKLDIFFEPALYQKLGGLSEDAKRILSRKNMPKSGSRTTLLGAKLKQKLIIRHIEPTCFLAWQKAFESVEFWKTNGFDYVPVEPIASYRLKKNGLVDVYSGVLDLTLANFENLPTHFFLGDQGEKNRSILLKKKDKILECLTSLGVNYCDPLSGHNHANNFCLRFFRTPEGKIDFSKCPRIYLIDFDQAYLEDKEN